MKPVCPRCTSGISYDYEMLPYQFRQGLDYAEEIQERLLRLEMSKARIEDLKAMIVKYKQKVAESTAAKKKAYEERALLQLASVRIKENVCNIVPFLNRIDRYDSESEVQRAERKKRRWINNVNDDEYVTI
jgi:hypothetical protein